MDVSKLVEKAREAAERRNYDYAIDLYLQACKLDPDNAQARRELRTVEIRLTQEKGSSFLTRGKTTMMGMQVQTLMMAKKWDSAIETAEDTLRNDPGNIGVMMQLGRACVHAGYKNSATYVFEAVIDLKAGNIPKMLVEASRELAKLYEDADQVNKAMSVWENVMKQVPGDREAALKYRDLSAKTVTTQIESATKTGQRGSTARANQTEDQKRAARRMDLEKGELKSEEDLNDMIEFVKEDIEKAVDERQTPNHYAKLGDLYKQAGNYDEAKTAYEQARAKDPNNTTWLFKLHDLEIWRMQLGLKALEPQVKAGDPAAREQYKAERLSYLDYRLNSYMEREKQYSTDSFIRYTLACLYFDLAGLKGDKSLYDQALTRFQATFRDPKFRIDSGLRLGMGFAAKGQYELAIKRLDETLQTLPREIKDEKWKQVMYVRGDTMVKAGRRADAKVCFTLIYEVDISYKDVSKRLDELADVQEPAAAKEEDGLEV